MLKRRIALIFSLVVICIMIYPQAPSQQSGIHIIDLMTAAEFRDSGLSKLTPQELNALDAWLNSYLLRFYKRVTQTTTSYGTPDVIESQIDGEFHGWTGDTIFKLTNGQIWQQAEYDYEYEYDYQPDVTIYKTGSGYKMQVKGMDSTVLVKRIK